MRIETIATIDFHVTSRCNQECPYCWGPQDYEDEVDTRCAVDIVRKIVETDARRIVFTGGDPLLRPDIGLLVRVAKHAGLEVALSTTGDELSAGFLRAYGRWIDLISLPLDGASEAVSSRTKKPGHFQSIMRDLDLLADHPFIDVKVATPVTQYNLADIPAIVAMLEARADGMPNRLFYNIFHAYPRSMSPTDWTEIIVGDEDFTQLKESLAGPHKKLTVNWLDHDTLDRLYVMVLPDGRLTVPSGPNYIDLGPFLDIDDLARTLSETDFDAPKHLLHSRGWSRSERRS